MNRHLPPVARRARARRRLLAATLLAFLPDPRQCARPNRKPAGVVVAQTDAKAAAEAARRAGGRPRSRQRRAGSRRGHQGGRPRGVHAKAADADGADAATRRAASRAPQGHHHRHRADRQYDSFDQFLDRDPGLAGHACWASCSSCS